MTDAVISVKQHTHAGAKIQRHDKTNKYRTHVYDTEQKQTECPVHESKSSARGEKHTLPQRAVMPTCLDRTYEMSALLNLSWPSHQMSTLRFSSINVLHDLGMRKRDRFLLCSLWHGDMEKNSVPELPGGDGEVKLGQEKRRVKSSRYLTD